MNVVMMGRCVKVTLNNVTTTTKLDCLVDAFTFVEVLEKIALRKDLSKLPVDFTIVLYEHLKSIGRICKPKERNDKPSERWRLLATHPLVMNGGRGCVGA